jgi:hypothetical protein
MKTGRNDPCPCGSGKKFKKCCEAKDEKARNEQLAAEQAALKDTLDPKEAERAKRKADAAARREGFQARGNQAGPQGRPSHARKRTV